MLIWRLICLGTELFHCVYASYYLLSFWFTVYELTSILGWGFDEADLEFYRQLFVSEGRDPTDVELFDLAQSNRY